MSDTQPTHGRQPLFTSRRERRLWTATLIVIAAIWSTLSLAGTLAASLRDRNMLDNTFFLAFLVLLAAIAAGALIRRPGKYEIWVGIGIVTVYGMALLRIWTPEERTHLIEYGLVAVLIYHALRERRRNGRSVPAPAVLAVASTALLGWVDEGIQSQLPNRVYDIIDVGFNALAGTMTVLATVVLAWARRLDLFAKRQR